LPRFKSNAALSKPVSKKNLLHAIARPGFE
jgi:hypothetical protein